MTALEVSETEAAHTARLGGRQEKGKDKEKENEEKTALDALARRTIACDEAAFGGAQFACFTSTKVLILTACFTSTKVPTLAPERRLEALDLLVQKY